MADLRQLNERASEQIATIQQAILRQNTVIMLVLLSCMATAALAESRKEYRFTVGPHATVSVDNQFGAIAVKPGDKDEVVVTATLKSDSVEIDQQQNGNRIEIASHLLNGANQQSGQVNYEILIPSDATLSLHSSTGPLTAERLQGDLTLEGAEAIVNVHDVDSGHVHVRTMRGAVSLANVRDGHIEIATISGDVHLKSVTGPLVQANTGSGNIFYEGDFGSSGEYRFTTHNGDIQALVPPDVSADFRAHSVLGRVKHDFPLQSHHSRFPQNAGSSFVGTAGKASSEVVLRSFSGKIRLKQR